MRNNAGHAAKQRRNFKFTTTEMQLNKRKMRNMRMISARKEHIGKGGFVRDGFQRVGHDALINAALVFSSKNWKVFKMGGSVEKIQKSLGPAFAALVSVQFLFAGAHHRKKREFEIQNTKVGDSFVTTTGADASGRSTSKTSTGNNARDFPEITTRTGAKFW